MTNRQKAEAMLARIAEYTAGWSDPACKPEFIEEDAADLIELLTPAHDHANGDSMIIDGRGVSTMKLYQLGGGRR